MQTLKQDFGIDQTVLSVLKCLRDYKIVLLCDDSGSMKTTVDNTKVTRWDELRILAKIIVLISIILNEDGIDIYFLNRPAILNVTDPMTVEDIFDDPPSGYSNLADALEYIFTLDINQHKKDKKMLVLTATDAEPTDQHDKEDLSKLEEVMRKKRRIETTHVMFLLCNDNPECVQYLSKWDREMQNVDLLDDFQSEKEKVAKQSGGQHQLSYTEYILKAMLGAIDPTWDQLGEICSN